MERHEYDKILELEENYWWFNGQYTLLKQVLSKYTTQTQSKHLSLLDIGCGTGKTLTVLQNYGTAQGIDISDTALEFCKKRNLNAIKSDVMNIELKDNTFDVITSLGIFYHKAITDDVKGFKEIYRILKPSGRFIITDSAMMCLFGKHDIAFHGARRYSKVELKQKLEAAGFIVEKITYFNTLMFPVAYLKRKLDNLSKTPPTSDLETSINPIINKILTKVYTTEIKSLKYMSYPFGINIVAVARKE